MQKPHSRDQAKHNAAIDALCEAIPGAKRSGFWLAVRDLADELGSDVCADKGFWRFMPDAYRINRDEQVIELHEIVNTHDLTSDKLALLGNFWFEWDCEESHDWTPRLFVHQEGCTTREHDLCFWFHSRLGDETSASGVGGYKFTEISAI